MYWSRSLRLWIFLYILSALSSRRWSNESFLISTVWWAIDWCWCVMAQRRQNTTTLRPQTNKWMTKNSKCSHPAREKRVNVMNSCLDRLLCYSLIKFSVSYDIPLSVIPIISVCKLTNTNSVVSTTEPWNGRKKNDVTFVNGTSAFMFAVTIHLVQARVKGDNCVWAKARKNY